LGEKRREGEGREVRVERLRDKIKEIKRRSELFVVVVDDVAAFESNIIFPQFRAFLGLVSIPSTRQTRFYCPFLF
jgi:hypothetical protein